MPSMEKVAGNLQQRIAQLVAQYEGDIAVLRADAQEQIEALQQQLTELKKSEDRNEAVSKGKESS